MYALFSQRNFGLLWIAHTISILGDYVFFIAITFWMYEQTHSALVTGSVIIASTIPGILFAPPAGMVVDRWKQRSIMLIAESVRAALFLALLCALIVQPHMLWPIYVVGFLQSAFATFFWSARGALLPQMIERSELLAANALYMMSDSVVRVIAPSLSALLLLQIGPAGIAAVDAVTFVISVICSFLLILAPAHHREAIFPLRGTRQKTVATMNKRLWHLIDLGAMRRMGGLLILGAIVAYTAGTLSILFPIFVQTTLAGSPLVYGWMMTAQAFGEGVMSIVLGHSTAQRGRFKIAGFLSGCFASGGLALVLIASLHALVPSLLFNVVFGAMTAAATVQLLTLLQQCTDGSVLGRTLAAYTGIQAFAQVGGMGVASMLVAHQGAPRLIICDGALYFLGSGVVWALVGPLRKMVFRHRP